MEQNNFSQELNHRLSDALNIALDKQLPANPQWWWQWWDDHNEAFLAGEKQTQVAYASREEAVVDRVSTGASGGRHECLVAGTLVWTESGPRAIETIVAGDLVLSQNVDTGELAYKPVLRATVRPAGPLVELRVGGETILSTGGHPLWITGEGWKKASKIACGMPLHGIEGSMVVAHAAEQQPQVTFNLIVADFHTYFITERKLLSHDNTPRQMTMAIVPGLKP